MTDLDILKQEWRSLSTENEILRQKNRELTMKLQTHNVTSNQDKLARSYRIGYMGFAFPALAYLLCSILNCSIWLAVVYGVYGIILGCFDLWFIRFIKSADYAVLPTIDALKHAVKVVKYQNWATVLSILVAIGVVTLLFMELSFLGEESAIVGGVIGGVFGGIIGAKKCIKNHQLARRMVKELKAVKDNQAK